MITIIFELNKGIRTKFYLISCASVQHQQSLFEITHDQQIIIISNNTNAVVNNTIRPT